MKKIVTILAAVLLAANMAGMTAFAHGCHGRGGGWGTRYQQPRYPVCAVEDCDVAGIHHHGDTWYSSPNGNAGTYYEVCPAEGCQIYGLHEHDGTYYYCGNHGYGYGCGRSIDW